MFVGVGAARVRNLFCKYFMFLSCDNDNVRETNTSKYDNLRSS